MSLNTLSIKTPLIKTSSISIKKLALSAIAITSMVIGYPAVANDDADDSNTAAAKALNSHLANTKTMTAHFTQTTSGNSKSLSAGKFSGSMSIKRPNKFRWETKSPSEQLVVANGSHLWIYDKDLAQATKQNVDSQIGNTPALLLSGDPAKIADNFTITQPIDGKNYFKLTPKSDNASFKDMTISFSGGKPTMMVLNDNLGQTTKITFSGVLLNSKVGDGLFNFTPPKGVDVISQ